MAISALNQMLMKLSKFMPVGSTQFQLGSYTTKITNGSTATAVAAFDTEGFSRITGLVKSDRALTCYVYQGTGQDDTDMEYVTSVAVPAAAGEGLGASFSVEITGQRAKITLNNSSGADTTTLQSAFYLRGV